MHGNCSGVLQGMLVCRPWGRIWAAEKPKALHASRKAAAVTRISGGHSHRRLDRVSIANAFAPAASTTCNFRAPRILEPKYCADMTNQSLYDGTSYDTEKMANPQGCETPCHAVTQSPAQIRTAGESPQLMPGLNPSLCRVQLKVCLTN